MHGKCTRIKMDNTTRTQTYAYEEENVTAQLRASRMNVCEKK